MHVDAEACTERSREQSAAGRRADEREGVEVDLDRTRRRPLVNHDVDAVVLHRGIQIFLDHGRESVNFVDEQHVVLLERGEDARQVARLVEHRTAGHLETHAQFVGDDVRESGLAQSWRAVQEGVVERFAAELRCLDKDAQVFHHLRLSAEVIEAQGAQCVLEVLLLRRQILLLAYVKIFVHA